MDGQKVFQLFDRGLDLLERIGIGDTHIAFTRLSKGIARDQCEVFFFKQCLTDFVARGGKVVGFKTGVNLLPPGGVVCGTRSRAVKEIRKLFQ